MPVYPAPSSLDSHLAIRVENLGKKYRIGAIHEKNKTFGEVLNKAARGPLRLARRMQQREKASSNSHSIFWALRNVSFEVARGQVVGIIGRNGAGKSTLLKLLSRIVTPDEGYAQIRGRMGSLLEVGTGFHFELTGRENIYLSGAIRGMRRQEIDHKFDEIVDFSGVEQFIDTPVKHYSSGMYLRLAFAVAAHLESEVLLVDEVLAVGDAEFQKKCLGKMGDVSQQGRTVLMVSHNMESIQHLCNQVIVLEKGQVYMIGSTQDGIASYLSMFSTAAEGNVDLSEHSNRSRGSIPILRNIRLLDQSGLPKNQFMSGEMLKIELTCDFPKDMSQPQLGIGFDDWLGT
ncbi:MAG: ATP-binding cassette domain-containing protein, partial [Chloroflexi bacterium]|nr:ATP-binding cassette domain-containing protein [Chloroflexota bacterium]